MKTMSKADKMFEEWVDCHGFEGLYQISNQGRVKSIRRYKKNNSKKQLVNEKIMSIQINKKNGYAYVSLSKEGKSYYKRVHILVMKSFVGINDFKNIVNHINGVRDDNRLSNLEWCNQKENIMKGHIRNGTYEKDDWVIERYLEGFSLKEIARVIGMTPPGIRAILDRNNAHPLNHENGWLDDDQQ